MLTFYHGSQVSVPQPDAKAGRKNLDFGPGFYLTKIREQAESWAIVMAGRKGRNAQPVLNTYHFDMDRAIADGIRIKSFPAYDLEWLDYVVDCRRGKDIITAEQALGQLRYKKVNHQLCILSQVVIDKYLTFVESSVLESEEDEP